MLGTLSQFTGGDVFLQPPSDAVNNRLKITTRHEDGGAQQGGISIVVPDPFRDLVINSHDSNFDPEQLKLLAISAASLNTTDVMQGNAKASSSTKSVKTLAGIFSGTETFVRKVEETLIKKKYAALDPSDSEPFGGQFPILFS